MGNKWSILILLVLLLGFVLGGCQGKGSLAPQPVDPSLDICHKCKMTLVDVAFVGQCLYENGQVYKFDDIGCMINYFKANNDEEKNAGAIYFMGYDSKEWLEVSEAYFVKGNMATPMSSGIVAVSTNSEAQSLADRIEGKVLSWEEVKDVHGS
ncbi:MAG: nitrous oxide reductase accessory protein NosL [Gracilibacteraceae bacterium]|jgi:copper chaperone NosL|nr:nitrous oxide reductase accessory protein NosL [Gracilibacteraceae bacterium]